MEFTPARYYSPSVVDPDTKVGDTLWNSGIKTRYVIVQSDEHLQRLRDDFERGGQFMEADDYEKRRVSVLFKSNGKASP